MTTQPPHAQHLPYLWFWAAEQRNSEHGQPAQARGPPPTLQTSTTSAAVCLNFEKSGPLNQVPLCFKWGTQSRWKHVS